MGVDAYATFSFVKVWDQNVTLDRVVMAVAKRLRVWHQVGDFYRAFACAVYFRATHLNLSDWLAKTDLACEAGERSASGPYWELPLAVLSLAFEITWLETAADRSFSTDYARVQVRRLGDGKRLSITLKAPAPDPERYKECVDRVQRAWSAVIKE
jgi:hypothetical protein